MDMPSHHLSGVQGLNRFTFKQLISWGEHLKVDQPQIDIQHKEIFELGGEIEEIWHNRGDLDQIKALAEKLTKLLENHFRYEEQQLAEIGYTRLDEHRNEHKVMLDELQNIRNRLESMGHGQIQSAPGFFVLSYILGVTIGHISHSDMDYYFFAKKSVIDSGKSWAGA